MALRLPASERIAVGRGVLTNFVASCDEVKPSNDPRGCWRSTPTGCRAPDMPRLHALSRLVTSALHTLFASVEILAPGSCNRARCCTPAPRGSLLYVTGGNTMPDEPRRGACTEYVDAGNDYRGKDSTENLDDGYQGSGIGSGFGVSLHPTS